MRADDLAPLLAKPGVPEVGFGQGVLLSWDSTSGSNTVQLGGATLTDLPMLAASTIQLAAGDVVGLLRVRSQYFILGRISPAGGGALTSQAAYVPTLEGTTSGTYTNLTTPGPSVSVYVGPSRQALVMISVQAQTPTPGACIASCAVSGATTIAAPAANQAGIGSDTSNGIISASTSSVTLVKNLNPGLNTFTMKYAINTVLGSGAGYFQARSIIVMPF